MKFKLIVLLAFISIAGARQLTASPTGSVYFSGCNCRGDGNPNPVVFSVSVVNPSNFPLTLSYMWYDPSIDFYRPGSDVMCGYASVLSPHNTASCTLTIYTMQGGLNGTSYPNIILTGTDGIYNYTQSFDIAVKYHTSPYEMNVLSRMYSAEYDLNQVAGSYSQKCYGGSCCGILPVKDKLSLALGNLSAANDSLRACQLSSSWNYIMNAVNSIRAANDSLIILKSNCSAAVSLMNDTGLRIASVSKLVEDGRRCGSNVTISQSQLSSANSSLSDAAQALASDNYGLAFSKLSDANSSLYSSMKSIGNCPSAAAPSKPVVTPVKQNSTNASSNQTSSGGDNTLLVIAVGAFLILLILAALIFAAGNMLKMRAPKKEEAPKPQVVLPPIQPPAAPPASQPQAANPIQDIHEDLEREFNEWLESHSQKK